MPYKGEINVHGFMQAQSNMMAGYMKQRFGERGHRVWRIILEHKYLQVR